MDTLIVGGGIGGLSAALALAGAGHRVELVERGAHFEAVGAGLVLAPNAVHALRSLGVEAAAFGQPLEALDITRRDGTRLSRLAPGPGQERYGPILAVARPALHAALVAALPPAVTVRLSTTFAAITPDERGVQVTLVPTEQPATQAGQTEVRRFDLVVGADGLRSPVRQALFGEVPTRYTGTTCWRGVVRNFGLRGAVEAWGGTTRVGAVPLVEDALYYYLVAEAPRRAPSPATPDELRQRFGRFHGLEPLFEQLHSLPPLHHDLEELDAPVWGAGRVVLLGDAAHAMTPNQGQGAAMAIEDAVALARAAEQGAAEVLERYQALRHQRVRRIQLDSRRVGEVAHWHHPLARATRDTVLRALPTSLGATQLGRLVEPGLALLTR